METPHKMHYIAEMRHPISRYQVSAILTTCGIVVACAVFTFSCPKARAQEVKIAYVNVAKVFDSYNKTKKSDSDLERKGKQKEKELEGRIKELQKLRENMELLSDEARERKRREVESKADSLKRFRADTVRALRGEREEMAEGILEDIRRAVGDYAKANGFSLIIDQRSVLYGSSVYDVTDEILGLLNR